MYLLPALITFIILSFIVLYGFAKAQPEIRELELEEEQREQLSFIHQSPNFEQLSKGWHEQLLHFVPFYAALNDENQTRFREKMLSFLHRINFIPIDFTLVDNDYLFVASSAVMPIFHLDNWMYPSLRNVVLHNRALGTFEDHEGNELYTAGLVNFNTAPDTVHLSRPVLWNDFHCDTASNVALHEFMHVIDSQDKQMDGVPGLLIDKKYIEPWIKLMLTEMKGVLDEKSNIDSYAGESRAEFLATVCEYYFKQPAEFRIQHPDMCDMMDKVFK